MNEYYVWCGCVYKFRNSDAPLDVCNRLLRAVRLHIAEPNVSVILSSVARASIMETRCTQHLICFVLSKSTQAHIHIVHFDAMIHARLCPRLAPYLTGYRIQSTTRQHRGCRLYSCLHGSIRRDASKSCNMYTSDYAACIHMITNSLMCAQRFSYAPVALRYGH